MTALKAAKVTLETELQSSKQEIITLKSDSDHLKAGTPILSSWFIDVNRHSRKQIAEGEDWSTRRAHQKARRRAQIAARGQERGVEVEGGAAREEQETRHGTQRPQ